MNPNKPLYLYEEIMLLALRDEAGVVATGFVEQAVAGAMLAELLLESRIFIDEKQGCVKLKGSRGFGDPLLDEALGEIAAAKRPVSLGAWVTRLARLPDIRHRVARQLCDRKILRADESKILFIFTRVTYPEINPVPERAIIERLRQAIFTDIAEVDARTSVLVSLAKGAEVLGQAFKRSDLRKCRQRIEQIANGELTGKATQEVIAGCRAAIMVAAIMPALIVPVISS